MSKLKVSIAPHISYPRTTRNIMLDVLIALAPAAIAGTIIFGLRSLAVIAACVASAVLSEFLFCLITKRKQTYTDLSAAVTGLLLALNLPATTPIWQAVIGSVFAVICVKCLFGGIGQNFANPAITARIFMLISFASVGQAAAPTVVDTVSGATPLEQLSAGNAVSLTDLLLGVRGGAIGETCIIALLVGGVYLVVRRVIKVYTPVAYVLTVFLITLIAEKGDLVASLAWIMSGGLILGAIFMATDYATTPVSALGKIVFGVGAGLITALIRFYGSYPEGVSFAILIMNILTPYIDRFTVRKPFGGDVK